MPQGLLTKNYIKLDTAFKKGYTTASEQGSARSSKTYSNVQWLINLCSTTAGMTVSIVRKTMPAIKRSVYRDFEEIMVDWGLWNTGKMNKSEYVYTFPNGSWIEFFSCENEQKLRGPKRKILFVNEANELTPLEWQQLQMRTTLFTIIDYNPSFSDEHWINFVNKEKKTFHWISTYKDNPFLEQRVVEEIEKLRTSNSSLWQVYGLGMQAIVEGLIFTNIEVINSIPAHVKKHHWRGIDFGYSCFRGDTLITTDKGNIRIDEIRPGDRVLTRYGYRRVLRRFDNGIKDVQVKEVVIDGRATTIAATENHNFHANGKWKKYGQLTEKDRLYVVSNLTGESINDTRLGSTRNTTTTSGRKVACITHSSSITRSGSSTTGRYRKDLSSTIKTVSLPTTTFQTLCSSLRHNMLGFTTSCRTIIESIQRNFVEGCSRKRTGNEGEKRSCYLLNLKRKVAKSAEQSLRQQTRIRNSAQNNAIGRGGLSIHPALSKDHASGAGQHSEQINTIQTDAAATNVRIDLQEISSLRQVGTEVCKVYDLEIEGVHEYFANGILVHNCDPTAIVDVFYHDGNLYLDELCYNTAMLSSDIIRVLKENDGSVETICESADPRLIQEIYRGGCNVRQVHKFGGSILAGISKMQQSPKIYITSRSVNGIKEFKNYTWAQDKEGHWLNKPIDAFNHFIDAVRYVCLEKILGGQRKPVNLTRLSNIAY